MTKNFNKDLDQSDGDKARKTAHSEGRKPQTGSDADPDVARDRTGAGFKGPADAYAEQGSRGAGYRETKSKPESGEEAESKQDD